MSTYDVTVEPTKAWGKGSIKMSKLEQHHLYNLLGVQFGLPTKTIDRAVYDAGVYRETEISSAWMVIKVRQIS